MIKKMPAAYPPSGSQLLLFGAALNEAPREVLLEVVEWLMAKDAIKNADNLQAERNLGYEIVGQMHRLKTAQRRA